MLPSLSAKLISKGILGPIEGLAVIAYEDDRQRPLFSKLNVAKGQGKRVYGSDRRNK